MVAGRPDNELRTLTGAKVTDAGLESAPPPPPERPRRRREALTGQAVSGVAWSFLARFGQQLINFLIAVVLARILTPDDFGLYGMLTVFMALSTTIADGGFGKSLIQKQNTDRLDESSMFYFNAVASLAIWGVLWLIAPLVADFYAQPALTDMLRVLGLSIVLAAVGMIHQTLLTKELRFRTLMTADWVATIVAGAVGIGCALAGLGFWGLVISSVSLQGTRSLTYWLIHSWRPQLSFSWARLRAMLPFGSNLLAARLIDEFFQHIYIIVIGRYYTAAQVGYYTRAQSLQRLPVGNFSMAVNHALFPLFSRVSSERQRVTRGLRKAVRVTAMSIIFAMACLAATADPLVPVLLGEKWRPSIELLRLLSAVGVLVALQSANLNAIKAIGRSDVILKLRLVQKVVIIIALVVTVPYGIPVMLCGQIAALAVNFFINAQVSKQLLNYGWKDQLLDVAPFALAGIVLLVTVYPLSLLSNLPPLVMLALQGLTAVVVYAGVCWALRCQEFLEALQFARGRLRGLGRRRTSREPAIEDSVREPSEV